MHCIFVHAIYMLRVENIRGRKLMDASSNASFYLYQWTQTEVRKFILSDDNTFLRLIHLWRIEYYMLNHFPTSHGFCRLLLSSVAYIANNMDPDQSAPSGEISNEHNIKDLHSYQ